VMGINCDEMFSPGTRLKTVGFVLAIIAQLRLIIHQMDVQTAFLNADFEGTVVHLATRWRYDWRRV